MLYFVVATRPEARPIIDHFQMKAADVAANFPLYGSENLRLIISGMGKSAAAAAAGYLRGLAPHTAAAWLNIGIAGHGQADIGLPLLAHKIVEYHSDLAHYPAITFIPPCQTTELTTVERPEENYPSPCAYDMEACSFWPTANLFATAELVHCLKVVSDNPSNPFKLLNKQRVESLVGQHLNLIEDLVHLLSATARELGQRHSPPPHFDLFVERWHFTATQRHQLQRLLSHLHTLAPEIDFTEPQIAYLRTGRDVLSFLQNCLADLSLDLCSTSST